MHKFLIVICGPTGIGKTKLAVEIAEQLRCEIISADSRQIFIEMCIGTAVPTANEMRSIPHHFIQSHSIHDYFNASMFEQEVIAFLNQYYITNDVCLMTGGSGMYINAVCEGIDELPAIDLKVRIKWQKLYQEKGLDFLLYHLNQIDVEYYKKVDKKNPKRLLKAIEIFEMTGKPYSSFLAKEKSPRPFKILKIGLNMDREKLYSIINERVEQMMQNGLPEEAKSLYLYKNLTPLNTVGYKELFEHFDGNISLNEAKNQIKNHSRAYARRQLTWFKRDKDITWFEPQDVEGIKTFIEKSLNE